MIKGFNIPTIEDAIIENQRVLVRVDYNVTLSQSGKIVDDLRMRKSLQTLQYLLVRGNRLILIAHLGQPQSKDPHFSLAPIALHLQKMLPHYTVKLVENFENKNAKSDFNNQTEQEVLLLENLRFSPGEKSADILFAKKLARLADVFIQDAFGSTHRNDASIIVLPKLLPSYAGLLLKKEVETISQLTKKLNHPYAAILGGAKVSTKIDMLYTLIHTVDYVLLGGVLANTFIASQGHKIGKSLHEPKVLKKAKNILQYAIHCKTKIFLPVDVVVTNPNDHSSDSHIVKIKNIPPDKAVYDIGPETQALYSSVISKAKTIIWNGPMGYMQLPQFCNGTNAIYYAITQNTKAFSVVGGGDTLAALPKIGYTQGISHISTGGGAMIEFIEKGTLPGLKALKIKPEA